MWMMRLAETAPDAPHGDGEERVSVRDEVHLTVLGLLPWAVSILLHAGIVILGLFLVWSTIIQPTTGEQIIPEVRLGETSSAPLQTTTLEKSITAQTRRILPRPAPPDPIQTMDVSEALIGLTDLAPPDPFGSTANPDDQFRTSFYGARGNAKRIVFLIDASGSIIEAMPWVIQELSRTIQQLSPQQSFHVIFFQQNRVIEVPPPGLKQATPDNKAAVIDWIDLSNHHVTPEGRGDPVPAIRQALQHQPQLLFILSDDITGRGRYEIDQRRLIKEVLEANRGNTKINTIQFLYPDPLLELGMKGTLELIAEKTGGVYRFVDEKDLYLR